MSPIRHHTSHARRARFRTAAVAAAAAGVIACASALAQTGAMLRGELTDSEVNAQIARMSAGTATEDDALATGATRYRPASQGAVADDDFAAIGDEPDTLFDLEPEPDTPFSDLDPPARPQSARERAEQARLAAAGQPQTAAERRDAELEAQRRGAGETTGTVRIEPLDALDRERNIAAEPAGARAAAIETIGRPAEEDPYAPLGLRLGTFTVNPSLETGITYTTNAYDSSEPAPATLSETTLRLNAVSDWPRHFARVDAYGTFRETISGAEISDREAGVDAELVLDLAGDYRLRAAGGYAVAPESASSPVLITGVVSRPTRQTLDGSVGLEKDAGRLRLAATGSVFRDWYGDAQLEDGSTLSQRDRDSTLASFVLRTGYEISPALTPFVEGEVGRRVYDEEIDSAGYRRSAKRLGARGGVAFDLGEKLDGEVSAGWISEELEDPRLAAISGATVAADIRWSPVRGTVLGLRGSTVVEGTNNPGESGSILYSAALTAERRLRANLTGNALLGAAYRDFSGIDVHDRILTAELGLTWWLNRYVGLTGRARHETVTSDLPDRESETSSIFLGVRLQR